MTHKNDKVILDSTSDPVEIQGNWIWDGKDGAIDQGVTCFFRRAFARDEVGKGPVLRISADSRYRVYLNGRLIGRGPARGTVEFYRFESIDLSEFLIPGENVLAVEVRWYGRKFEPRAEVHLAPGLWAMIGSPESPAAVVTDSSWKIRRSQGHCLFSRPTNHPVSGWYTVADPGENVDFSKIPSNWQEPGFDDSVWSNAIVLGPALGRYQARSWWFVGHELVPRPIPLLEEFPILPLEVFQVGTISAELPVRAERGFEGKIAPNTKPDIEVKVFWGDTAAPLVLEGTGTDYIIVKMPRLFTGYPRLTVDAPEGTIVEFRYAEALSRNFKKGLRDDPAGTVEGYHDLFTCRKGRTVVEPFVWRTFWFLRITVHHPAGTVRLENLETIFTAYPFREQATFESSEPLFKQFWDTSWWTARLCAHETYEDCPYYEQIQYIYDTRLQAMVGYMVAGDFRLARQALRQFAHSRRSDGIILGRAPAVAWEPVILPTLSLIWVEFLEDFFMYSGDRDFVKELWDCLEGILRWFEQFEQDGLLDNVPYWVFTDWTLPEGRHICGSTGELNMRRIGALQAAARLARAVNKNDRAEYFTSVVRRAKSAVQKRLWSDKEKLFRDEPDGALVAEHASILALLYDVPAEPQVRQILEQLEKRDNLARTSLSYSFYTFRACEKLGAPAYEKVFRGRLYNWTDQLARHATTWFETGEPSRSDCHGWGSWIMCDLLTSVLGITPSEPGFAKVRIAPKLLDLAWATGSVPTVRGKISVAWHWRDGKVLGEINLPDEVTGVCVSPSGQQFSLVPGKNTVEFD